MTAAAGDQQYARLHQTFEALCRIPSPTGNERAVADWVASELGSLGLDVQEDTAGAGAGSNAGNLLARTAGVGAPVVLLCAHLDTVPLTAPLEPVCRHGIWENAEPGVLGADNKAAVAALVELARTLAHRTPAAAAPCVELLFTVAEETGLNGAKQFEVSRLQSPYGYVFDHASPIGEIITAAPSHVRVEAVMRGRAAHAGLEPEAGVSAITATARAIINLPQGRLGPGTTANVGTVRGGTAVNVVPDECTLMYEVRAIERADLDRTVTATIDALQDAADSSGCDLDLSAQEMFAGYRLSARDRGVMSAARALSSLGYEPSQRSTGGGSDANAFRRAGFECTNLANGTEHAHQRDERVSVSALDANLRLMLALVDEARAGSTPVRSGDERV